MNPMIRPILACRRRLLTAALMLALSACSLQQQNPRIAIYDFGPGPLSASAVNPSGQLPALLLDVLDAPAALDSTAVLYRLAYADSQQLRPYGLARWSMTPAQLLRQRLRQHLGQQRALLTPGDSVELTAGQPLRLQIELEEFSQLFESPEKSSGLLRLRATLSRPGPKGGQWLAQRSVVVRRSADSADAAAGVRALTAATDAAAQELEQWLKEFAQQPGASPQR